MSVVTTELRQRVNKDAPAERQRSAEEILVEKLDAFLSSIERRLDRFDEYFKVVNEPIQDPEGEGDDTPGRSRLSSSASLTSLKSFSKSNLNKVYELLSAVKDQVLKTSVLNLEYLYKALDDKYTYLFNQDVEDDFETKEQAPTNRELLTRKIITNLNYFEQRLTDIDMLIKSKTPQATANYDEDARFNRFRFYNFNKALRAAQQGYLHYYQLPLSWRENRYIIYGYRFNLSHREMLKSMFHFNHNETGNIWTHMIGAMAIAYLGLVHFPSTEVFAANTRTGNAVMFIFIAAALECLISSVLWHTYSCFAQIKVRNRFACVDYTGITVLITCSVIIAEYCSLYHQPKLLATFIGFLCFSGMAGFLFNWSPYFDRPECRPLRIGFFVSLAFLGSTTFLCKWYYEGFFLAFYFFSPLTYKSFLWYWLGVIFYGGLIPERWRYDVIVNEDDTCHHDHSALDVIFGNIEHSGMEELQEMKNAMDHGCCQEHAKCCRGAVATGRTPGQPNEASNRGQCSCASKHGEEDAEKALEEEIVRKHFPAAPQKTPYYNDLLSLWWVDYFFQSHNIWHIFVVFGVVGHYFCMVGMFEKIHGMS